MHIVSLNSLPFQCYCKYFLSEAEFEEEVNTEHSSLILVLVSHKIEIGVRIKEEE